MSFIERVKSQDIKDFIAEQAKVLLADHKRRFCMVPSRMTPRRQAMENRARYERLAEELRAAWRAAARGDEEAALTLMTAFANANSELSPLTCRRMLMAVEVKRTGTITPRPRCRDCGALAHEGACAF